MSELSVIHRCLVTGANGFLGGYLLEHLQQKHIFTRAVVRGTVRGTVRNHQNNIVQCDQVVTAELLPETCCETWLDGIDTVFYLAGTAHLSADAKQYETDCLAAVNVARCAAKLGVQRFVFVSTAKAEDSSVKPTEPYGYWKRKTEEKLSEMDIPHLAIVRPCLVYGAGVKGNVLKMISAIEKGYFPPLPAMQAQRSMVFGGDVANALLLAAVHPDANRQALIVADGESYTSSDLYAAIRKGLGRAPATWHIPLPVLKAIGTVGDAIEKLGMASPVNSDAIARLTESAVYSSEKLKQLGWKPTTTFYRELPNMLSAIHQKY